MDEHIWSALAGELDAWQAAGRVASLWWRDDDATAPSPALDRLLDMSARMAAPVTLAVIPAKMSQDLPQRLNGAGKVHVAQHGYAHVDHAPKGEGAWELGSHRPMPTVLAELARGRNILSAAFGRRFVPVVVPPWTHIDPPLVPRLTQAGFVGLSDFGARRARHPAPGLVQVNAHCDPIKWKGGARFTGTAAALDDVVRHLARRRRREVDAAEPTGLLTHHLDMGDDVWSFVERLLAHLNAHPAARWTDLAARMAEEEAAPA